MQVKLKIDSAKKRRGSSLERGQGLRLTLILECAYGKLDLFILGVQENCAAIDFLSNHHLQRRR